MVITLAEILWDQLKMQRRSSGSLPKDQQPFNSRSMDDLLAFLDGTQTEEDECFLCLVIHNIDGPGLRDSDTQQHLARIAACSHIRVVASIDHVNAPLCKYSLINASRQTIIVSCYFLFFWRFLLFSSCYLLVRTMNTTYESRVASSLPFKVWSWNLSKCTSQTGWGWSFQFSLWVRRVSLLNGEIWTANIYTTCAT